MIRPPVRKRLSRLSRFQWAGIPLVLSLLAACSFSGAGHDDGKIIQASPESFVHEFRGQAVWTSAGGGAGMAGELVLLLQADPGLGEVCFSSGPVVFFIYRRTARGWTLRFPARTGRDQSGRQIASRLLQPALLGAWSGESGNPDWNLQRELSGAFVFSNRSTGEKLAGILETK